MGVILNSSPFIPEDIRVEVTALQNFVYEINALRIDHLHSAQDLLQWREQRRQLNEQISDFNNHQKSKALRNSCIDDTKLLLSMYIDAHSCIQATQMTSKGMDCDVFITYSIETIGFSEFFSSQPKLHNRYLQLINSITLLAHCVFHNLNYPSDGNAIFERFICTGGINPYSTGSHNTLIIEDIKCEQASTISGIKKYLMYFFVELFGNEIAPITSRIARRFIKGISDGQDVKSLIDVLFEAYESEKKKNPYQGGKTDFSSSISRHVAWCTYRGLHQECILLQQPCHASVDCAFYRENPSKRNPY